MIPNYQALMRPILESARSGEVKLSQVIEELANTLGLSEEEKSELLPSGKQTVLANRVGWAKTYLAKAGLLEATRRGHFQISARGLLALEESNACIDADYLKQFEEFQTFLATKNEPGSGQTASEADQEITPDEALRAAFKLINQALISELLERTRKVTPAFFEHLLVELLLAMGYGGSGEGAAHALGRTGDNGVDGVINQDPLGVDQIYLQAKRYAEGNNVSAGDIRDFFGALNLKKAQKGIFITTSDFTQSATQTAKDLGSRIVLINGNELAKLMLRYNIGCREEQVLSLKKIDEEFFEI
ncbi:restriction endonuclease [Bowmanella denitrificans]|uniref:restriction endonuclease n=1 Tax=Bowmanella denitrificans TaxID=366582 RepID=UPI000C9C3D55|nr:restriction endonuclease [Bowmanella denitrificans]